MYKVAGGPILRSLYISYLVTVIFRDSDVKQIFCFLERKRYIRKRPFYICFAYYLFFVFNSKNMVFHKFSINEFLKQNKYLRLRAVLIVFHGTCTYRIVLFDVWDMCDYWNKVESEYQKKWNIMCYRSCGWWSIFK